MEKEDHLPLAASCAMLLTLLSLSLLILYKLFRPYFNVRVSCWFCGAALSVPYGNRNCWDCIHCEQYNGFNKDGDYNKPIPAQYNEDLNHPTGSTKRLDTNQLPIVNKLCKICSDNQQLKVRQLRNFTPANQANFDQEVELFEKRLEREYRLCFSCEQVVKDELAKQNAILKPKLMRYKMLKKQRDISETDTTLVADRNVFHTLSYCARLVLIILMLIDLLVVAYDLPLFKLLRVERLTSLCNVVKSHRTQCLLAGLVIQFASFVGNFMIRGLYLGDFLQCVLWVTNYGHEVLKSHYLLPPVLSSPKFSLILPSVILLVQFKRLLSCRPSYVRETRSWSPTKSNIGDWKSPRSNHSDSGVSVGQAHSGEMDNNAVPEECEDMELDISTLSLDKNPSANIINHVEIPPPSYEPLMRRSRFDSSSGRMTPTPSVYSFRTTHSRSSQPRLQTTHRSPSRSSLYSPAMNYQPSHAGSVRPSHAGSIRASHAGSRRAASFRNSGNDYNYMPGVVTTPPSVSNYRSVGSSPDSPTSTIYGSASYLPVPMDQRMTPEKTSLITQILLGISLGVNVSIAAFILGRYSVNGDLLSFI